MSTFVNAFKQAGICPLNRNNIDESKVMPSNHFFSQQSSGQSEPSSISVTSSAESQSSQVKALKAMESVMKQETVTGLLKAMISKLMRCIVFGQN